MAMTFLQQHQKQMKREKIHQLTMHLLRKVVVVNGYSQINCDFTGALTSCVQVTVGRSCMFSAACSQ